MPHDAALLSRYAAAGDEAAFREFVAGHINTVYASALRRVGGDAHFAADVTQQVFFAAAQNAARLAHHPMIAGWLFTTTRNIATQLVRKEQRRKARELSSAARELSSAGREPSLAPATPDPDWSSVARFLDRALDRLNPLDRTAILLRFMQHRAYGEIGRDLNLSEDAARMRVDRAMLKLRALLAQNGVQSSAAAIATAMTAYGATSAPAALTASVTTSAITGAKLVAAGASAGVFGIFTPAKSALLASGLVVVSALTYGVFTGVRAHRAEAAASTARGERDRLLAGQRALEARARQAESLLATDTAPEARAAIGRDGSDGVNASSSGSVAANPRATTPETRQVYNDIVKAEHTDPELLRLRVEEARVRLPARYAPLVRALALSPEQTRTFEALLLRRTEASLGLMADKFNRGYAEGSAELRALQERTQREQLAPIDASLRSLLGEEGYARFAAYERLAPARPLVDALAAALHYTAQPLGAAQSLELAQVLAATANGAADWPRLDAPEMMSRVQAVLAAEQLAAFESLRRQADLQRQIAARRAQLRTRVIEDAVAAGAGK